MFLFRSCIIYKVSDQIRNLNIFTYFGVERNYCKIKKYIERSKNNWKSSKLIIKDKSQSKTI